MVWVQDIHMDVSKQPAHQSLITTLPTCFPAFRYSNATLESSKSNTLSMMVSRRMFFSSIKRMSVSKSTLGPTAMPLQTESLVYHKNLQ